MLRITVIILLLLIPRLVWSEIAAIDDAGNTIGLSSPAKRIISLAPHITEILYTIDAGDKLVATVEYSDYPEKAKQLRRIGGYNALDIESILALQPDLMVAWRSGNNPVQIEKLQNPTILTI